jgi:hypothetical protein
LRHEFAIRAEYLAVVASEVADGGVELCEADLHAKESRRTLRAARAAVDGGAVDRLG